MAVTSGDLTYVLCWECFNGVREGGGKGGDRAVHACLCVCGMMAGQVCARVCGVKAHAAQYMLGYTPRIHQSHRKHVLQHTNQPS